MDKTSPPIAPLKPALASIRDACTYLGGVSRAKFYSDILPQLDTVHLGTRHFIVIASMDRLIASRVGKAESPKANKDAASYEQCGRKVP
jgi:hypothetical protein